MGKTKIKCIPTKTVDLSHVLARNINILLEDGMKLQNARAEMCFIELTFKVEEKKMKFPDCGSTNMGLARARSNSAKSQGDRKMTRARKAFKDMIGGVVSALKFFKWAFIEIFKMLWVFSPPVLLVPFVRGIFKVPVVVIVAIFWVPFWFSYVWGELMNV